MFRDKNSASRQGFFYNTIDYLIGLVIGGLPHFPLFNTLKSFLMRARGAKIGLRVKYLAGVWIDRFSELDIGDDVSLARGVTMVASGGIAIGARTMIGYGSVLLSANHKIPDERGEMRFSGVELKRVVVGDDVWIGARVVVLPGVNIGEGVVVGAGSVVTKDIAPFSVVAGVPAELIRMRR